MPEERYRWYQELTAYHWFVLVVAALGWLFDTMDQQLFLLARVDAIRDLMGDAIPPGTELRDLIAQYSGYATSIFMLGWAAGGIFFGVLGDRIGRVKTMILTILLYSLFTGLSAFSTGFWDFAFYRFLTGLGVGGEFAVGVTLVAEVMPARARPYALGLLQALSAVGNMTAALVGMSLGHLERGGAFNELMLFGTELKAWRLMFVVGVLPALLVVVIQRRLKEPDRWKTSMQEGLATNRKAGSYAELFGDPRWRKNAIVGLILASSGVVGLWGIGFFFPDLIDSVFRKSLAGSGKSAVEINGEITWWKGIASLMVNVGAFFGIYAFTLLTQRIGRRPAFFVTFLAAMGSTLLVFSQLREPRDVFWMLPLMGFCQLALFGGYAIYFPELFPTRLRSTGTSFCYNVGRIVAATGPALLGQLRSNVFSDYAEPMRPAAMVMCSVFLLGILVLPFAPETKDQPLPD